MKGFVFRPPAGTVALGVLALGFLVLGVLGALGASAAAESADRIRLDPAAIDRYVESEMAEARIPGLALAIVRDGEPLYVRGYGVADPSGRPVGPETPFKLGSVSKSITALAVMQLVESGKLDLDAPVQRYLPTFLDAPVQRYLPEFRTADEEASKRITVRHLLNQTSGISTYDGEVAFSSDPAKSPADLLRELSSLSPTAAPGERFQYSNLNYVALGEVVAAASGVPYGEYVESQIFRPLGMTRSFGAERPAEAAGLASGYRSAFGFVLPGPRDYHAGNLAAGYLVSSAADMARYVAMWQGDGRLGDVAVVSQADARALREPAVQTRGSSRYAMGWYTNAEGSVVWHGGSTFDSRSSVKMLTNDRLAVVVLANLTDSTQQGIFGEGFLIGEGVISLLYGERPPTAGFVGSGRVFFALDALALLFVGYVGWDLLRLWRWLVAPTARPRRRAAHAATTAVVNFALPLAVLLGVPTTIAWTVVVANLPDFGWVVLGGCVLLVAIGLGKAAALAGGRGEGAAAR